MNHDGKLIYSKIKNMKHLSMSNNRDNFYEDLEFFDDDDDNEDGDSSIFSELTESQNFRDSSGSQQRQFRLGNDIMITDFVGSLGFDEVTDWEYYYENDEDGNEIQRQVVQPPLFDSSKPKRTRSSSGSVVRLYRGEFIGKLNSSLRSRGMDVRVLIKEFSGKTASDLAEAEVQSISTIQSLFCDECSEDAKNGRWASSASSRYLISKTKGSTKADDESLLKFLELISKSNQKQLFDFGNKMSESRSITNLPFVAILGQLTLAEVFEDKDFDPNEWYRALGVKPPKPDSVWLIYEYCGLSTLENYAQPSLKRWSNLPAKRGIFGNMIPPPPLPSWKERAKYLTNGILKGALEAVAVLHENGITHRSIGKSSIILSSSGMDKQEASSPLSVSTSTLQVKLTDLGFSGPISDSSLDESFCRRAKAFGIDINKDGAWSYSSSIAATNFSIAEDLHALGFVFIAVLLSVLADIPSPMYSSIPATDEDTLQRLLGDIFEKDMDEFRNYCKAEEIWGKVVDLLDENDKAGWELLKALCFARENAAEMNKELQSNPDNPPSFVTARGLLSSPFFSA